MTALFLSPHSDDEALFGAFTILREKAEVIVVLESRGTGDVRAAETMNAMAFLGADWRTDQWEFREEQPDWDAVEARLRVRDRNFGYDRVFAPAVEEGGHEHHSRVGEIAADVFGGRVTHYLTYRRGHGKSRGGTEVVPEPDWIALKHRALACYRSQMRPETGCQPWFLDDLREYIQPA